jgi:hypothetical protein
MLEPPSPAKSEYGPRIDQLMRALAAAIENYRAAVIAENGPEHAEDRVSNAVRNGARRAGLGPVFGLS